jgi:hypothetical protein
VAFAALFVGYNVYKVADATRYKERDLWLELRTEKCVKNFVAKISPKTIIKMESFFELEVRPKGINNVKRFKL